jgi:hypothetical protein
MFHAFKIEVICTFMLVSAALLFKTARTSPGKDNVLGALSMACIVMAL